MGGLGSLTNYLLFLFRARRSLEHNRRLWKINCKVSLLVSIFSLKNIIIKYINKKALTVNSSDIVSLEHHFIALLNTSHHLRVLLQ